jgi:hypothetical protein
MRRGQRSLGTFGNDPREIKAARSNLAIALFSVASEDSRDVEVSKKAGLLSMALDYRDTRWSAVASVFHIP